MKSSSTLISLVLLALTAGCTSLSVGHNSMDCEFMLPTEREQCLHVNETSREAVKDKARMEKERKAQVRDGQAQADEAMQEQKKSTSPRVSTETP